MVGVVLQNHLEISASALALTSASALQEINFSLSIMNQKIHEEVLFITLAGLPERF